jgi:hypothetical protein
MTHHLHLRPLLSLLATCLSCASLVACNTPSLAIEQTQTPKAIAADAKASRAFAYNGLFISPCSELDNGLYFADALELKPKNGTTVNAQYIKAFFSSSQCETDSRLVQLRMPLATWEIVGLVTINDKSVDQVKVTLGAGLITGVISNASKVKETAAMFDISYGNKDSNLPLQKQSDGAVEKELRLLDGNKLYFSDSGSPTSGDGFPTGLALDDAFLKQ